MKTPERDPDWPEDVVALYQHDMQEIWDPSLVPHIWTMYHDELRRYRQAAALQGDELRILDVGCAQATLALLLAEDGHHVTAMDIRQQFLDYAKSRYETGDITFVAANALEYDTDDRYDLIFANQVLEHLVYPVEFLSKLTGWLVAGGRIIATTPNAGYIRSSLPTFRELGDPAKYEDRQFTADGDGHFFAYALHEFRDVFLAAGLDHVQVRRYASPWITGHLKFRFLHGVLPRAWLRMLDRMALGIPGIGPLISYQLWGEGCAP